MWQHVTAEQAEGLKASRASKPHKCITYVIILRSNPGTHLPKAKGLRADGQSSGLTLTKHTRTQPVPD